MKKRPVNLERTDENIADQYPDIFDGLQKDAIQNAWDAKLTKKGRDWKLIFKYEPVHNTLIIEDFGTTGMNEEKWERYQGLWHTDKIEDYEAAGSRGQGKFLFHYFSKKRTRDVMCFWNNNSFPHSLFLFSLREKKNVWRKRKERRVCKAIP